MIVTEQKIINLIDLIKVFLILYSKLLTKNSLKTKILTN